MGSWQGAPFNRVYARRLAPLPRGRFGCTEREEPSRSTRRAKLSETIGCARRRLRPLLLMALIGLADIVLAATIVISYYELNYVMPHSLDTGRNLVTDAGVSASDATPVSAAGTAPAGTFTDAVVSTDAEYHSPDISITLTRAFYDTGIRDTSAGDLHARYGTHVAYTLADIYVRDASSICTAFAQNTYGVGFTELLSSMSARMGSVLAVNGDSYSNNRHASNGTIVRNGVVYRAQPSTEETCVLYRDGTMRILPPGAIDVNQLVSDGAWQSWVFGPSLLDENGGAKTKFTTWNYITESHPRTAIGYYGPGHYCLLVVDGREPGYSRGMFLGEMSRLFADLGCKAAYNLDGGHCASMTKGATVVSRPYKLDKEISDGIFVCEQGGIS